MAPDKNKLAAECFRKGTEAMSKENWDYCIDMFGRAAGLSPDNLVYRQTKHGAARKKYGDNGSGARMASVKLMGVRGKIKKARMQKDWESVDRLAEDGLNINPWDSGMFADLAAASTQRELDQVALYAWERAVEYDPDNVDYSKTLGYLYRDRGDYLKAMQCFERVYKLRPNDSEARTLVGQLQAESVMDRGGYDEAKDTKDVKASPTDAYELDRQARKGRPQVDGPGQSEEADLQHAVRKDPTDVNGYLKLADYYRSSKNYEQAVATFKKALDVSGGDHDVREQMEDAELDLLRFNEHAAQQAAARADATEKTKENATALRKELTKREITVLSNRTERYPNDMRLKYELGLRFKRIRKFTQAIPVLQQASADTRLKEDVLVALGECFVADQKLDLGRRQFEKALATLNQQDKPDLYKTANYFLGRLYEKAGQADKADHHYTEILAVDYEYKDVLKRLEALQGDDEGSL